MNQKLVEINIHLLPKQTNKPHEHCTLIYLGASWNVMAHAQKPDFVFRRNGRVHLNGRGTSVQSTAGSRGVRISASNAGYTMFRGSVKSPVHSLHSPVSPSLPLPCVTVCHHTSTAVYFCTTRIGSSIPPSTGRNTSTHSENMLWKWVMICDWNHPDFVDMVGLHAAVLVRITPSTSRCRLCTIHFNVKSWANRRTCTTTHVNQGKRRLFHCM